MTMSPERCQKIEQLYHAALERDKADRAAYLGEACAAWNPQLPGGRDHLPICFSSARNRRFAQLK
jgi:hypothetical protein